MSPHLLISVHHLCKPEEATYNDNYNNCCFAGIHLVCVFVDSEVAQQEQQYKTIDITRLSASSAGSTKFYREFDGTTSAKLSRTSKLGHQGILVTPRVMK